MQKSLFYRYYSVCVAVLLATIVVLGIVLMTFVTQYFKADKYRLLSSNAKKVSAFAIANYIKNDGKYLEQTVMNSVMNMLADSTDADIFITDANGKTILCTEDTTCIHKAYLVTNSILKKADTGEFREFGTLGGIYKKTFYTVGVPMIVNNGAQSGTIGYAFASFSSEIFVRFLIDIFNMFLLSSIAVLVLSFIIIYFVTRRLVMPLKQMAIATRSFAKGDFSQRIPVDGQDEVAQLAVSFNNMASSLSVLESMRRSFVANVSHELKTPMTTIGGFIDGILDGTIPPEKQNHYLSIVSNEVKRLSRLVRSMLNIARIEAGEMTIMPQVFDIHDKICQTVFIFEQTIEEKHIEIRGLDTDKVMVEADPDLIHQVIYNLVENAIKFVNDGGYIEFAIYGDSDKTFVSVKNSGEGIASDEVSHVFDRFYKTDKSRSVDKNGVGLGLHIVRSIINLHSGDIVVRSSHGEYVEFVFSLKSAREYPPKFKKS